MLRYFYILICIHVSFSYDFTERNLRRGLKVRDNRKHNVESKVVQLDMDSFMSSDDDSQDYEPFDSNLNRGTQNEDYYESPINKFKREENADYSNLKGDNGETVGTLKDDRALNVLTSVKAKKENKISPAKERGAEERHAVHNPEKNCLFRNMKIPFFSRKTAKQLKRRKLECMNCGGLYINDPELQANLKVNQLVRRLKRGYGNVCPNCIRNLLQRFHKKQLTKPVTPTQVHKSKEFYQVTATTVSGEDEGKKKANQNSYGYTIDEQTKIKERQLKELAEVERKVTKRTLVVPLERCSGSVSKKRTTNKEKLKNEEALDRKNGRLLLPEAKAQFELPIDNLEYILRTSSPHDTLELPPST